MLRIEVPKRVNDNPEDFTHLLELAHGIASERREVVLNLSGCEFIQPAALVMLGGAALAARARGAAISLIWPQDDVVFRFLGKSCFREVFGGTPHGFKDNSIPFRVDSAPDPKAVVAFLRNEWIGRGWLNVSNALAQAIVGRMCEVYDNAFCHSRSAIGTVTCGQHYPTKKRLTLTIADFGVGIPSTVRAYLNIPTMDDKVALEWAFQDGNTTRRDNGPRGIGLKLLRDFVALNGGRMYVYSNKARAEFSSVAGRFESLATPFCGTLFHIRLNCKEARYRLASEAPLPRDFP